MVVFGNTTRGGKTVQLSLLSFETPELENRSTILDI